MALINFEYHPHFFTATILKWQHLLDNDLFKDVIIRSLQFLVNEGSIVIYAFVIMPNHIHLIWQVQDGYQASSVQQRFLKFTAQQFKFLLFITLPENKTRSLVTKTTNLTRPNEQTNTT
jgi:REP element-mobilizing transposase RayT